MSDSTSDKQHKTDRLLLVAIVLAVYGLSLGNSFVWDDRIFFIGNPVYMDFNLRAIFFSLANGVEYLPLRDITYAVDYLVWGKNPLGFHLSNLIFFSLNIIAVHKLAGLITGRLPGRKGRAPSRFLPIAVAAGFALHPLNTEVVNFITCRNVLVSGLFFFISCICMIRYLEKSTSDSFTDSQKNAFKWYAAALLAFIGALLSKATSIMLPLLLLFVLPILFPQMLRRIATALAPFFALSAIFYIVFSRIAKASSLVDRDFAQLSLQNLERKIAIAAQIPFFYLKKLLLPYGFSVEYVTGFSYRIASIGVISALLALALLAILIIRYRQKAPEFSLGALWFGAALFPVLNFFATHPPVADRYAYLPAFGFMLILASLIDKISAKRVKTVLAALLCILLAGLSISRSLDWRTDETLWKANIRNFPDNTKSYVNLADHYFNARQQEKALDLLSQNNRVPWLNLYHDYFKGKLLLDRNNPAAAKELFQRPLEVAGGFIGPLYCLGLIAEQDGDHVAAAQFYSRALSSEEKDFFLQIPLVKMRLQEIKMNHLDKQIAFLKQSLSQNPADKALRRDLAITLDRLGYYSEALEQYLILANSGVKAWQIYQNIANCYFNLNMPNEAISYYEQVLALEGGVEDTFNNLGIAYRKLEKYDKSIALLEQGVRQFPDSPYPAFNLAITYDAADQKENSLRTFYAIKQKFPDFKDRTAPYIMKLSTTNR